MIGDGVRQGEKATTVVERGILVRYRIMAFTTATLLIILVFVGLPLQFAAGRPQVVNLVGTVHGFLYIVYLYVAFQLTRRLRIPKWQMALVLLAGTVPFCAFIAERKLTRRFEATASSAPPEHPATKRRAASAGRLRQRWLSRRALLLHLEVALVAPGCVAAGWWQATRALAGNTLSWFYSIEWPVFALLAVVGWWFLIHEDPEAYRARRRPPLEVPSGDLAAAAEPRRSFEVTTGRLATLLAILVGIELALGIGTLVLLPVGRPTGVLPHKAVAIYLAHALVGLPLAFGAVLLLARVRNGARISRVSGWLGLIGIALAGFGGLLTVAHPVRVLGMVLMFVGPVIAGFGYLFPALERSS